MPAIASLSGRAVPLLGNDIDTDRIIPARFLRCVTFDGLGEHAFEDDRAQARRQGQVHPFDDSRFRGARILVVNGNFGCGSSREHAPQALARWGITAIVGVSFSEIFFGNCVAMGLPCLRVAGADAERLQARVAADPTLIATVDIAALTVAIPGLVISGQMGAGHRQQFLTGQWDATSELVEGLPQVRARAAALPYLHGFPAA
jgi:3-isopropylmalate/(R)-2-methylmalate dehydratase small subunit